MDVGGVGRDGALDGRNPRVLEVLHVTAASRASAADPILEDALRDASRYVNDRHVEPFAGPDSR
ncbi:hypothetical protein C496_03428 [Natronorubrum tibetense GA33]|uniref:Uncharacterized protein n=1 Tax=Natronorubrum tibetense GA33 TaxID=1114856 RepID=L9W7I0_9EURY|nr:hypothetical protein C496_03428 [Natronorubrum tibetense GA33]